MVVDSRAISSTHTLAVCGPSPGHNVAQVAPASLWPLLAGGQLLSHLYVLYHLCLLT